MTPSFNAINCRKQSETTHSTVLKGLKLEIFYTIDISQNYSLKSSFGGCIKCKVSLDKKNFNKWLLKGSFAVKINGLFESVAKVDIAVKNPSSWFSKNISA